MLSVTSFGSYGNVSRLIALCVVGTLFLSVLHAQAQQTTAATVSGKTHYNNAVAAIDKGDWVSAQKELLVAARLAPQNSLVHYDLALAYDHNGNSAVATEEASKALTLGLPIEQKLNAEKLIQKLKNSTSVARTPSSQEASGPSLEETTAWLHDKIVSLGGWSHASRITERGFQRTWVNNATSFKYTDLAIRGSELELKITQVVSSDNPDLSLTINSRVTVDLKSLDFASATIAEAPIPVDTADNENIVSGDKSFISLGIPTIGKQKLGSVQNQIIGKSFGNDVKYATSSEIDISFTDADLAKRALAALKHAAELSKPEPF